MEVNGVLDTPRSQCPRSASHETLTQKPTLTTSASARDHAGRADAQTRGRRGGRRTVWATTRPVWRGRRGCGSALVPGCTLAAAFVVGVRAALRSVALMALSERSVTHSMTVAITSFTNAINASTSQSDIAFDATTTATARHDRPPRTSFVAGRGGRASHPHPTSKRVCGRRSSC